MDKLTNKEILEKIENYLKRTQETNLFKILGLQKGSENRHSNFLAWLLNPKENHNLGTYFLKAFLNIKDDNVAILREKVIEKGRPDITILDKNGNAICIIEVKFGAGETNCQFKTYYEKYGSNCRYVLLDINNKCYNNLENKYQEGDFDFCKIYELKTFNENILPIIKDILHKVNQKIDSNIRSYLEQYANLLEEQYELYNDYYIQDLVLKYSQNSGDINILNNLFSKYNYQHGDYLQRRRYKIMEVLFNIVNKGDTYNNSLSFNTKNNIRYTNDGRKVKNCSEIYYIRDKQTEVLFNEDDYNDKLFYIEESKIKNNLIERLKYIPDLM